MWLAERPDRLSWLLLLLLLLCLLCSARQRVDHAAERFQLPDTSHINTHHAHVPPIFVVQLQIPSEPPKSMFSSSDNGPGWALVMYYRITEDTCRQLKDLSTASPAVKLWAEWCEKAQHDAAMRARFKVRPPRPRR